MHSIPVILVTAFKVPGRAFVSLLAGPIRNRPVKVSLSVYIFAGVCGLIEGA